MVARTVAVLVLAAVAGGVVGCSGTRFGDALSESFGPAAPSGDGATPDRVSPDPAAADPVAPAGPPAPAPAPAAAEPASPPAPSPVSPTEAPPQQADYRIVLLLPAADATAPTEALGAALRQAGVSFSVESILRLQAAEPPEPASPSSEAAPAPGPAAGSGPAADGG